MLEIDHFRKQIEKRIGRIQHITPIRKGFSIEEKFKTITGEGDYLLRLSSMKTYASKTREFELVRQLYENGVRCNKPIIMLRNDIQETVCAVYSYLPGIYSAEINQATYAELNQAVGSHEDQHNTPQKKAYPAPGVSE